MSDNEDDYAGCLDSKLESPGSVTAHDFINADDGMQVAAHHADAEIVADVADAEDADSSSDEHCDKENQLPCSAAELSSDCSVIRPLLWRNGRALAFLFWTLSTSSKAA